MAESARVLATEAMAEAKAALAEFAQTVDRSLTEVDSDIQRLTQWLQHDRPAYWKREVRRRHDDVHKAKAEIARKELIRSPEPASVVEERKALARARERLAEAERRQEATRRWGANFEREAMAYKGPAHELRDVVAVRIPAALSRITRMMESLEAYLSMSAPSGDPDAPPPDAAGVVTDESSIDPDARAADPTPTPEAPGETHP